MLRTLLIVGFLVLAMIAPVWIPVLAVKALAPRPTATRLDEDDSGRRNIVRTGVRFREKRLTLFMAAGEAGEYTAAGSRAPCGAFVP
jgi:hypothetical protein